MHHISHVGTYIVATIAVALWFAVGWVLAPKMGIRAANLRTERISTMLQAELKNAVEQVQNLLAQLSRTELERDDLERRVGEILGTISVTHKERDKWQELYSDQSICHGNAQACMMDAIGYLEHRLKQANIEVKLPEAIRLTQQLYYERHVEPLIQSSAATVVTRTAPAPAPPDTMSTERTQDKSSHPEKQA